MSKTKLLNWFKEGQITIPATFVNTLQKPENK